MPSTMSMNTARPDTSVMIGRVCGSHSIRRWPFSTLASRIDQQARAEGHAGGGPSRDRSRRAGPAPRSGPAPPGAACCRRTRVPLSSCIVPSTVGFDARALGRLLRRAADVEGPHGQLGARLADALRGDHADRLAGVDRRAARQIAAVAPAADAAAALAGQHRAHLDALDHRLVEQLDLLLVEQDVALDQDLAGGRMQDVLGRGPAQDPLGQLLDHLAALDDRRQRDRLGRCRSPPRR